MIDEAELDGAVMHRPAAILTLDKAHRLANQRLTDINLAATPADCSVAVNPPQCRIGRIFGLAQNAVPAPRRTRIVLGRGSVAQRGMRPLLIVEALKVAEPPELLAQAARRRAGGIAQQSQVQPFEPTVLLRFAGGNPLRPNPRLDDFDR